MRDAVRNRWQTAVLVLFLGVVGAAGPAPAQATVWCGENGTVRFSFVAGDSLVDVLDSGAAEGGVTRVRLAAWLTDVVPVAHDGERFMRIGGYELYLTITGAEGFILKQEFPSEGLDVGRKAGEIAVGLRPGERLVDGRVLLVTWEIMFQGRPENVRFGLDGTSIVTCPNVEGCPEAAPQMLYVGASASNSIGATFGAGYVPAWLNPVGEPDQTPLHSKQSFEDVGIYTAY